MQHLRYSVLIRTWNSGLTLPSCLNGIRSQSFAPSRILIVDSGSTDGTLQIADAHDVEILHYPASLRFNYSRSINIGMQVLDTPFVLLLSSHTILETPCASSLMLAELSEHQHVFSVYAVPIGGGTPRRERDRFEITATNFTGHNGF
jgi:glycosyltransferase involved in cell wall biosynthesis